MESCKCGRPKKAKHTLCRKCFLGEEAFRAEKARLETVKLRRDVKRERRHKFECEMGYEDCERRGYCNGDC